MTVPNNRQRGTGFPRCLSAGSLACSSREPRAAGIWRSGVWDWSAGVRMGLALLSWVLMLLWVSTAQAEVLVQPDFDAQKVLIGPHAVPGWGED